MVHTAVQKWSSAGPCAGGGWRSNLASSFCPSGSSTTTLLRPLSSSDWPAASSTRIRQTTFSSRLNWLLSTQNGPGAPCCAPRTRSPSTNNCLRATPWAPAASTSPTMAVKPTTTGNAFIKSPSCCDQTSRFSRTILVDRLEWIDSNLSFPRLTLARARFEFVDQTKDFGSNCFREEVVDDGPKAGNRVHAR